MKKFHQLVKKHHPSLLEEFNEVLKKKGIDQHIAISEIHFIQHNEALTENCHQETSCTNVIDPRTGLPKTVCTTITVCP